VVDVEDFDRLRCHPIEDPAGIADEGNDPNTGWLPALAGMADVIT
jgi:hypothetical protein